MSHLSATNRLQGISFRPPLGTCRSDLPIRRLPLEQQQTHLYQREKLRTSSKKSTTLKGHAKKIQNNGTLRRSVKTELRDDTKRRVSCNRDVILLLRKWFDSSRSIWPQMKTASNSRSRGHTDVDFPRHMMSRTRGILADGNNGQGRYDLCQSALNVCACTNCVIAGFFRHGIIHKCDGGCLF